MENIESFLRKQREELSGKRDAVIRQREELDSQLQEIDREFAALDAYERARKGETVGTARTNGKRRTGVRQTVLDAVKRHPKGITRAELLAQMGAKGEKRAEQSISNALANLKKQGHINLNEGQYTPV